MQYVDKLLQNDCFRRELEVIEQEERDRIYCRHDIEHLLAVARIAYLLSLKQTQPAAQESCAALSAKDRHDQSHRQDDSDNQELIYITALLHDIGRGRQYREGIPHEQASVLLAENILQEIGYPVSNRKLVLAAIAGHRGSSQPEQKQAPQADVFQEDLSKWLRCADHMSRNCFCCHAAATCNWTKERRNTGICF